MEVASGEELALYSIATLVAYIMLLAAANTASAAPAKGEIKALITDMVYQAYPQCVSDRRHTDEDKLWCFDRVIAEYDAAVS